MNGGMNQAPPDQLTAETVWTMATVPFIILVALLFTVVVFVLWLHAYREGDPEHRFDLALWIGGALVTGLIGLSLWWGMYPWKAEYHEWRAVSGTVEQVNHRLTSTGEKTMEDKYVVKFTGNRQQYGVLDTRMATVEEGDQLIVTCVRRYQWAGAHGYDCNFVDTQRN